MSDELRLKLAREDVARFWNLACDHDGIDKSAAFILFSTGNPFVAKYNEAVGSYLRLRYPRENTIAQ